MNKAQQVPLGMYLMIDKSRSMSGANWDATTTAIKDFVLQPSAAGIGVGLQFFPLQGAVMCGVAACTTDADCGAPECGPFAGFRVCRRSKNGFERSWCRGVTRTCNPATG